MGGRDHGAKALSWWGSTAPPTGVNVTVGTYVGVTFEVTERKKLQGFRLYTNPQTDVNNHWALLWDMNTPLWCARSWYPLNSNNGAFWFQTWVTSRIFLETTSTYRLAVLLHTQYFRQNTALVTPVTHNGITYIGSFQTTSIDPTLATISGNTNANGVDILVAP